MTGKKVFLKDEAGQKTGSFKVRGVLFEVETAVEARLKEIEDKPELAQQPFYIVTQTDGNHGIAMIYAVASIRRKYKRRYHLDPNMVTFINNIRPVVYTIKGLPDTKIGLLEKERDLYNF